MKFEPRSSPSPSRSDSLMPIVALSDDHSVTLLSNDFDDDSSRVVHSNSPAFPVEVPCYIVTLLSDDSNDDSSPVIPNDPPAIPAEFLVEPIEVCAVPFECPAETVMVHAVAVEVPSILDEVIVVPVEFLELPPIVVQVAQVPSNTSPAILDHEIVVSNLFTF